MEEQVVDAGTVRHLLFFGSVMFDKKKGFRWHFIELEENDGRKLEIDQDRLAFYGPKLSKGAKPGLIISVLVQQNNTVLLNSVKYVGVWKNDKDVAEWTASNLAANLAEAHDKKIAKELRDRLPAHQLSIFREAYKRATAQERIYLLAMVINEITGK